MLRGQQWGDASFTAPACADGRFTVVREGKGAILFKDNAVFYNQAQVSAA